MIGFSTGCFYKNMDPASPEAVALVAESGAKLVEISAVVAARLDSLDRIDPASLDSFEYVAIHAPADIRYRDDEQTKRVLAALKHACDRFPVRHVAFHPDAIEDWEVVDDADLPAAFENMDKFKKFGGSFADMTLALASHRDMILDLVHAYTNDPTLALARDLADRFADRIVAVHVSGCRKHEEDNQHHSPLSVTEQREIVAVVPPGHPVVLEGVWPPGMSHGDLVAGLRKEIEYVSRVLGEGA